jgi:hypothetical protein
MRLLANKNSSETERVFTNRSQTDLLYPQSITSCLDFYRQEVILYWIKKNPNRA